MSDQNQEPVSSPNTQKRAPPPVPSRERRSSLGGPSDSASSLPTTLSPITENHDVLNENPDDDNNNSATIDESTDGNEGTTEFVEPEYVVEQIPPIELVNGDSLVDQWVAPKHYRHYIVLVTGNNDDVVDFRVSRTLRSGGTNIYVNAPKPGVSVVKLLEPLKNISEENGSEQTKPILDAVTPLFPTKTSHDWNPTKGVFLGSVGEYLISVEGIANYIEKDDKYLISPDSNWTNFDLLSEWSVLDEETRKKLEEISAKFKKEKVNSVWSSSYSQEVGTKYESLLADYQQELERRELEQQEQDFDLRKVDLQDLLQVNIDQLSSQPSFPLPVTSVKFPNKYQISTENTDSTRYSVTRRIQSSDLVAYIVDTKIAEECGIQTKLLLRQIAALKAPFPHLAQVVDVFQSQNGVLGFVYSNLPPTNLLSAVASSTQYSEAHARTVIQHVVNALNHLHSVNLIHAAVAAENVFARNFDRVQDLTAVLHGLEFLRDTKENETFGYPLQYQAPELLGNESASPATDMWSLGCLSYLLLVGKLPFDDNNRIKLSGKIRQGIFEIPSTVPAEAQSFIKGLLSVDSSKRLTSVAAKDHSWLKSSSSISLSAVSSNLKH